MARIKPTILTSDAAVATKGGLVHWVSVSAGATGGAFQLNDSTDDSGDDLLNITMPATTVAHFHFGDNPIEFHTGIYCDIPGTNLTVNVGYTI